MASCLRNAWPLPSTVGTPALHLALSRNLPLFAKDEKNSNIKFSYPCQNYPVEFHSLSEALLKRAATVTLLKTFAEPYSF